MRMDVSVCTETCARVLRQHPDSVLWMGFDFERSLFKRWEPGKEFLIAHRIRPTASTGYEYEVTAAGQSGRKEPIWPRTPGSTVQDGSIQWTCRALSDQSLSAVVTGVDWSSDPGIALSSQLLHGHRALVVVSGGEDGRIYRVQADATLDNGNHIVGEAFIEICKAEARDCC